MILSREILDRLLERLRASYPRTATELAESVDEGPQKVLAALRLLQRDRLVVLGGDERWSPAEALD